MKTIELREISPKQAKKEIKEYFSKNHGKAFDAAMIQEVLKIDIWDVMEALGVLEAEGEIVLFKAGRAYKMEKK